MAQKKSTKTEPEAVEASETTETVEAAPEVAVVESVELPSPNLNIIGKWRGLTGRRALSREG